MRVKLDNVTKSFGETQVLQGISFDQEVTTLAVIGPSGGGKSTLLRILGGLDAPTKGTVAIDGQVVSYDERDLVKYRADLGFVFQDGGLFEHLSALENVALPLRVVHGMASEDAQARAHQLLERFGLGDDLLKRPAQLSGGQRQRVAIARAVAPEPRFVLFDEPTSALDPEYTNEVLDLMGDLSREGMQFIVVTHEMGFALHACDAVAFLCEGSIMEYGPSQQVFDNPQTPQLQRFLGRLLEWRV